MASPKKSPAPAKKAAGVKKTGKKTKDPNAPKRAMGAYFMWMNEVRDSIKKPGESGPVVAKRAGEMWRNMSDDDKAEWTKKAASDKERYEKEIAAYKN